MFISKELVLCSDSIILCKLSVYTDLSAQFAKNKSVFSDCRRETVKISGFRLIAGVYIPDVSTVKREYRIQKDKILLSLSAEDYKPFFTKAVKLIKEPVFFFAEIPSDDDSMRTYYLDNCTAPVVQAILKRYGGILFADGVIRFGFGSNSSDEEIYMQSYQTVSVYSKNVAEYERILRSLGYQRNDRAVLTWDVLSEKNTGECVNVEVDDEGYHDMINNLIDVGMYSAE